MDRPTTPPIILVVDDEALLRLRAADLLEDAGYQVIEAADPKAALKILEERPEVRLLFTDIQMPGGCDGLQLAAKVHERWPKILLLITSGQVKVADQDIPDDGRFVGKPYQDQTLIRQVGSLIADQDARRSTDRSDAVSGPPAASEGHPQRSLADDLDARGRIGHALVVGSASAEL